MDTRGSGTHVLVKLESLIHLAREAIDEEATLSVLPAVAFAVLGESSTHGVLEELDGDLHGHNLAFTDVLANHLAILGAFAVLLRAEKVAGWTGGVTRGEMEEGREGEMRCRRLGRATRTDTPDRWQKPKSLTRFAH